MGWTRRPNSSDKDTNPDSETNPLADNLRLNRRRADSPPDNPIYDQQTVVDSNFASRSEARRQRQGTSRLNTQQLGTWAADPDNTRKLLMIGGAFVIFLLLLAAISFYNRESPAVGTIEDVLPSDAPFVDPNAGLGVPEASADPALGTAPVPVATIPGSDPAQQPAAPAAPAFIVTGTGAEGLFLRPEPNTNGAPLTTLPEGTRVEATGETNNDGTREWRKVRSTLGEGWVAADFLQSAP